MAHNRDCFACLVISGMAHVSIVQADITSWLFLARLQPLQLLCPCECLPACLPLCVSWCRALTQLLFPCLESLPNVQPVPEQPHHQQPGNAPDW